MATKEAPRETVEGLIIRQMEHIGALSTQHDELLAALEMSYLGMLAAPPVYRLRIQPHLCAARDAICKATGREAQDVQDSYEEAALHLREGLGTVEAVLRRARNQ